MFSGCFATVRRINQPLESTQGTPVGPADASPPRPDLIPGHAPVTRVASGGTSAAVAIPSSRARARTASNLESAGSRMRSIGVDRNRSRDAASIHELGQRNGVAAGLITGQCIRIPTDLLRNVPAAPHPDDALGLPHEVIEFAGSEHFAAKPALLIDTAHASRDT